MKRNIIWFLCGSFLVLMVIFVFSFDQTERIFSIDTTIEEVSIRKGDKDNPIIPNEDDHIDNFMRASGMSESEVMDIINNPENYLYIDCLVKVENKGNVEVLLKGPAVEMMKKDGVWLLNEIEGYQEVLPNTDTRTGVFLVAKNTPENNNFKASIPMRLEYTEKLLFMQVRNTIVSWTKG